MNLNNGTNGQQYRITWLVGDNGDYLKRRFDLREEDKIRMVQNLRGNVLIDHEGRKLAMDKNVANAVKVESVA